MWSSDQTLMKNFKKGIQMTKLYLLENKLYDFDKIKKGVAVLGNDERKGSLIKKLHSSNNSKGKEKCKGKEKIVEHLDSTKSYEKFIAEVLDKTHISLQAICIWENLNQRQKELYKFYDVELLSYNNEQDKVIAINQLSIWLNTMTHVGQYYFIPWNIGKHWMLIIAMTSGRVVFLNPLKSKIPSDIAQMIKAAYANISSNAIVFGKNGPEIWTFACPKQPYNYECGYYVLTYIRDMLQHSNPIEAIKAKFGGLSQYSEDDHLLPLRQQWLIGGRRTELGEIRRRGKISKVVDVRASLGHDKQHTVVIAVNLKTTVVVVAKTACNWIKWNENLSKRFFEERRVEKVVRCWNFFLVRLIIEIEACAHPLSHFLINQVQI
ncbi:hypothetical protein F8388_026011 [Cannabis sativa]|uniref:Ubiquitin-like protease family profile domain-containing protein n=1 Tax=Cannabis sativa TaxID=3483 RepID=A0A7J6EC45_CANSA|nr:hypothetical protein F8388_026011 [Cannabis sativa]